MQNALLRELLRVEFKESRMLEQLDAWEVDVGVYETTANTTISDDVRISTVINGLENRRLKDHLQLKSGIDTYGELVGEIKGYMVSIADWRSKTVTNGPAPMEIGGLQKGKGKGKGK